MALLTLHGTGCTQTVRAITCFAWTSLRLSSSPQKSLLEPSAIAASNA
jgi:hypothetical protein